MAGKVPHPFPSTSSGSAGLRPLWNPNPANPSPHAAAPGSPPPTQTVELVKYNPVCIPTARNPFDSSHRLSGPMAPLVAGHRYLKGLTDTVPDPATLTPEEWDHNVSRLNFMFQTGRRFRFLSDETGRALQILWDTATQKFFLDGTGAKDMRADARCNSAWTVNNMGNSQFQFHCNDHYLTVVDGWATVVNMAAVQEGEPGYSDLERTWELTIARGNLYLQSAFFMVIGPRGRGYLAVTETGGLILTIDCTLQRACKWGVQPLAALETFEDVPPRAHQHPWVPIVQHPPAPSHQPPLAPSHQPPPALIYQPLQAPIHQRPQAVSHQPLGLQAPSHQALQAPSHQPPQAPSHQPSQAQSHQPPQAPIHHPLGLQAPSHQSLQAPSHQALQAVSHQPQQALQAVSHQPQQAVSHQPPSAHQAPPAHQLSRR